jgi:hypothetical protein
MTESTRDKRRPSVLTVDTLSLDRERNAGCVGAPDGHNQARVDARPAVLVCRSDLSSYPDPVLAEASKGDSLAWIQLRSQPSSCPGCARR